MKRLIALLFVLLPTTTWAAFFCDPTPDGFYCVAKPHYYCVYSGDDIYCQKPGAPFYCTPTDDGYYCNEKHNNKYYCTWVGKSLHCVD